MTNEEQDEMQINTTAIPIARTQSTETTPSA